jgi:hypothetical protein
VFVAGLNSNQQPQFTDFESTRFFSSHTVPQLILNSRGIPKGDHQIQEGMLFWFSAGLLCSHPWLLGNAFTRNDFPGSDSHQRELRR